MMDAKIIDDIVAAAGRHRQSVIIIDLMCTVLKDILPVWDKGELKLRK